MKNFEVTSLEKINNPVSIKFNVLFHLDTTNEEYDPRHLTFQSTITQIPYDHVRLLQKAGIPFYLDHKNKICFISSDLKIIKPEYQIKKNNYVFSIITNVSDEIFTTVLEKAKIKYHHVTDNNNSEYFINSLQYLFNFKIR
jgi:hypothetical protein